MEESGWMVGWGVSMRTLVSLAWWHVDELWLVRLVGRRFDVVSGFWFVDGAKGQEKLGQARVGSAFLVE